MVKVKVGVRAGERERLGIMVRVKANIKIARAGITAKARVGVKFNSLCPGLLLTTVSK